MDKKSAESAIRQNKKITGGKKVFFFIFMICLPFFFLFVAEIILRGINYGGDLNLVLTRKINGTTYCYINKKVARRFFSQQDIHIPDARNAVFKKEKSAETYRIFCLGGSTTAGFPYEFNATFPSLLKDRLDTLFPGKNIEVINIGISAINSYSVLDFTQELIKYDADLFLIYMGHNEFYGALGISSTQQIANNRNVVLLYLQLQKYRLFNLMRNMIANIKRLFVKNSDQLNQNQTLMEQVVKDRYIKLGSKEYRTACGYFSLNLEEIVNTAQKSGAKVILSTLVSNLADQEPFNWLFDPKIRPAKQQQWKDYLEAGYRLEKNGTPADALLQYQKAKKIDTAPALLHYRQAKSLQMIGEIDSARKEYIRAKDYDVLRFRASSDFNDVIRQIGNRNNIPVIEMEDSFAPYCKDKILDRNLFADHLHPNFEGYLLMAKAFCEKMSDINCIVPIRQWKRATEKPEEEYRRIAGVTDLDIEIANYRIEKLTSNFPFKHKITLRENLNNEYANLLKKTVQKMFDKKIGWNEAHYRIAKYLEKKGEYDNAAFEYEAVIKVTPFNYFPNLELANLFMRQKRYKLAETTLNRALTFSQNLPYAYAKLGMLYFFTDRPELAIKRLEQAVEKNKTSNRFKDDELAGAFYIKSMAYAKLGKLSLAKKAAQEALKIKPEYEEVKAVMKKLNILKEKKSFKDNKN